MIKLTVTSKCKDQNDIFIHFYLRLQMLQMFYKCHQATKHNAFTNVLQMLEIYNN